MTINDNGMGACDKCGRTLSSTGAAYAVRCTGMDPDTGNMVSLLICTRDCAATFFDTVYDGEWFSED